MQSKKLTFPRGLMQILSNIRQFPQLFIEKANWDSLYLVRKGGGVRENIVVERRKKDFDLSNMWF